MKEQPTRGRGRRRSGAATLSDVARAADVSLATASRALNGSTGRKVRADLRERVMAAAAALDYAPDSTAQAMARGWTASIGLIVHDIDDPYFSAIAAGVTAEADAAGMIVTLGTIQHDPRREPALIRTLQQQRARAIILAGGRRGDAAETAAVRNALEAYLRRGGSVAAIGQPVLGVPTVRPDNAGGAAELARRLLEKGYRGFAVLAGPSDHLTASERSAAFLGVIDGSGAAPPRVVHSAFTWEGGYEAFNEAYEGVREGGRPPEVVWAVNDVMALGALAAARDLGANVPGDVAVAGFDDIASLRDAVPALTTVRLPLEALGRQAARLALASAAESGGRAADETGRLPGGDEEGHPIVTVSGEVVLRASTPGR